MKIDRNLKNGLPNIVFEKNDISDLARVEEMFSGKFHCNKCGIPYENGGWEIFKKYLESERIKLEAFMKLSVSINKVDDIQTKVEVAKLVGFDHFLELENKIKLKLEKLREVPKENKNDEPNPYGD